MFHPMQQKRLEAEQPLALELTCSRDQPWRAQLEVYVNMGTRVAQLAGEGIREL